MVALPHLVTLLEHASARPRSSLPPNPHATCSGSTPGTQSRRVNHGARGTLDGNSGDASDKWLRGFETELNDASLSWCILAYQTLGIILGRRGRNEDNIGGKKLVIVGYRHGQLTAEGGCRRTAACDSANRNRVRRSLCECRREGSAHTPCADNDVFFTLLLLCLALRRSRDQGTTTIFPSTRPAQSNRYRWLL